jgi:hypothetical protein
MAEQKLNGWQKIKTADKECKNGWRKKIKNEMIDNVIGKSKLMTQNKK